MARTTAIVSVAAQQDNLGDIEIRSVLLDWITSSPVEVHVYRGAMSDSYIQSFLAYPSICWHRSHVRLQAAMLGAALRGNHIHFFLAPGPQVFSSRAVDTIKGLSNLLNAGLAKLTGGDSHVLGRAFRGMGASRWPTLAIARLSSTLALRDPLSQASLGGMGEVYPDLALYPERWSERPKRYVVFCLREANGLQDSNFDNAIAVAKELGLEPIFVVQVKRDNALARRIAGRLGLRAVAWDDQSHMCQLARAEDIYAQAAIVVSNRLHGLLLGARAGAVPIPVSAVGDTKLLPTLGVCFADIESLAVPELRNATQSDWRRIFEGACSNAARQRLWGNIESARLSLTGLRRVLAARLENR